MHYLCRHESPILVGIIIATHLWHQCTTCADINLILIVGIIIATHLWHWCTTCADINLSVLVQITYCHTLILWHWCTTFADINLFLLHILFCISLTVHISDLWTLIIFHINKLHTKGIRYVLPYIHIYTSPPIIVKLKWWVHMAQLPQLLRGQWQIDSWHCNRWVHKCITETNIFIHSIIGWYWESIQNFLLPHWRCWKHTSMPQL